MTRGYDYSVKEKFRRAEGEEQMRGRQDAEQLREAQELEEQHYAEQPRHRAEQKRTGTIKKKPDLTRSELLRKRQKMARGHG